MLTAALGALKGQLDVNTVIILVLIVVIDRRLFAMVKSMTDVANGNTASNTVFAAYMLEIRTYLMRISERIDERDK